MSKTDLAEDDARGYNHAAAHVGASRWASAPAHPPPTALRVVTSMGKSGETWIALIDANTISPPLAQHCMFAIVWPDSASTNAQGTALALAVQSPDSWRELSLFHHASDDWRIDVVPPAAGNPELGCVEFAG